MSGCPVCPVDFWGPAVIVSRMSQYQVTVLVHLNIELPVEAADAEAAMALAERQMGATFPDAAGIEAIDVHAAAASTSSN